MRSQHCRPRFAVAFRVATLMRTNLWAKLSSSESDTRPRVMAIELWAFGRTPRNPRRVLARGGRRHCDGAVHRRDDHGAVLMAGECGEIHGACAERFAARSRVAGAHEPAHDSWTESVLRRTTDPAGCRSRGGRGLAYLRDGPQRDGQDHPAEVHHGAIACDHKRDDLRRNRPAGPAVRRAGRARHRLRAPGWRDGSASHG